MKSEDFGKEYIRKIEERVGYAYKKLENDMNWEIQNLHDALQKCVREHAEDFDLSLNNNDHDHAYGNIAFYEMAARVKSKESLQEKIIRKEQFFYFLDKMGRIIDRWKGDELAELIKEKNDDLMGIRFLVPLSCDCIKIYGLLKKYEEELKENGITFEDLESNPQTMRNGRPIFRIKGKYEVQAEAEHKKNGRVVGEKYPFELQIKSKLDSAWADLEHMLFYKDYQLSYIQSTNQQAMNKVGNLLDQVDELMFQIRESHTSYEKNWKEMEFTQYLGTKFKDDILSIIGSTFVLSDYRRILFHIFLKRFKASEQSLILQARDRYEGKEKFDSLKVVEVDKDKTFVVNYRDLKEKHLGFIISEHIYVEWLRASGRYRGNVTKDELAEYFKELIIGSFIDKTEYYFEKLNEKNSFENDNEKDNFFNWAGETVLDTLDAREIIFNNNFLVDSEIMYMLYSFYMTDKNAADDKTKKIDDNMKKRIKDINNEVIAFLFEDGKIKEDEVSEAEKNIRTKIEEYKELKNYYNRTFIDSINEEYKKVDRTSSGKAMLKNNILSKLFKKVLGINDPE